MDLMTMAALVLLAAVEIGGAFGSASAGTLELRDDSMLVELRVEVNISAQSVVAHLVAQGDETILLPLLSRGDGSFGLSTELPKKDFLVLFEALGDPGALSQGVTLTGLGASLTEVTGPEGDVSEPGDENALSEETSRYGWLALALGAGSLSALAFWVLGARDDEAKVAAGAVTEEE